MIAFPRLGTFTSFPSETFELRLIKSSTSEVSLTTTSEKVIFPLVSGSAEYLLSPILSTTLLITSLSATVAELLLVDHSVEGLVP